MLKSRILTALILIPIALYLVLFSSPALFRIAMGVVVLVAAWEWCGLMQIKSLIGRIGYLLAMWVVMGLSYRFKAIYLLGFSVIYWATMLYFVVTYPATDRFWKKGIWARAVMGVFTLVPCWYSLLFIRSTAGGSVLLIFLMIMVWAADSGAYFAGRMWGRAKMLPQVSPGKTWVGFVGGLLLSLSIAVGFLLPMSLSLSGMIAMVGIVILTVIFSVLGDFFESMLKREAGLKDSGHIFPGHGGLLDRIDSLAAAAPVFLFGLLLLNIKL